MPHVVALYRYPVKSFTPEACEVLTVLDEGRIAGDRVLGIRFANSGVPDDAWSKKHEFVALVNTPGLARLKLRFDHKALRLHISLEDTVLVDEALDDNGRKRIASAIENYVLQLDENPLSSHPDRLPLRVVGDGITSRYQDNEAGHDNPCIAVKAWQLLPMPSVMQNLVSFVFAQTSPSKAWRPGKSKAGWGENFVSVRLFSMW